MLPIYPQAIYKIHPKNNRAKKFLKNDEKYKLLNKHLDSSQESLVLEMKKGNV